MHLPGFLGWALRVGSGFVSCSRLLQKQLNQPEFEFGPDSSFVFSSGFIGCSRFIRLGWRYTDSENRLLGFV